MATQSVLHDAVQRLQGLINGHGASSSAVGPSCTPSRNHEGVPNDDGHGGGSTMRGPTLELVLPIRGPIVPPLADDNDKFIVEKF